MLQRSQTNDGEGIVKKKLKVGDKVTVRIASLNADGQKIELRSMATVAEHKGKLVLKLVNGLFAPLSAARIYRRPNQ